MVIPRQRLSCSNQFRYDGDRHDSRAVNQESNLNNSRCNVGSSNGYNDNIRNFRNNGNNRESFGNSLRGGVKKRNPLCI